MLVVLYPPSLRTLICLVSAFSWGRRPHIWRPKKTLKVKWIQGGDGDGRVVIVMMVRPGDDGSDTRRMVVSSGGDNDDGKVVMGW